MTKCSIAFGRWPHAIEHLVIPSTEGQISSKFSKNVKTSKYSKISNFKKILNSHKILKFSKNFKHFIFHKISKFQCWEQKTQTYLKICSYLINKKKITIR
jgi:hypothetical protein